MLDPVSPATEYAVVSVSSLNRQVRACLESTFPLTWVGGEISNLTYAASGHVYFSLKDATAQVRCVMWRTRAQLLGWRLENGDRIEARALVSFYEPRGEFQLNVDAARLAGRGALHEQFARLKAKLEAAGYRRIGDLRIADEAALRRIVGNHSRLLLALARGEDQRPVISSRDEQS